TNPFYPFSQFVGTETHELVSPERAVEERLLVSCLVQVVHQVARQRWDAIGPARVGKDVCLLPYDDERGRIRSGDLRDEASSIAARERELCILDNFQPEGKVRRRGRHAVVPFEVRLELPGDLHLTIG